jgi:tryptophan 2,3-dioxygenase
MSVQQPLSYKDYLKIDELLGLQNLISKPRQHDEVLFIIAHQTFELWFKLILNELETSIRLMISGEIPEATRLLRRVAEVEKLLIVQIEVLETIRPTDFLKFRNVLTPASGFQSLQFREIEFISGLKDERYLRLHIDDELDYEQLLKRWEAPTLWDGFRKVLRDSGFDIDAVDQKNVNANETKRLIFEKELEAVATLYTEKTKVQIIELAEALLEYDKNFWLWRDHHISMVERVIGRKVGTGSESIKDTLGSFASGGAGAAYLESTLRKRFFPVLWEARTKLE